MLSAVLAWCFASLVLRHPLAPHTPSRAPAVAAVAVAGDGAASPQSLADDEGVTKVLRKPAPPGGKPAPPYGALVQLLYTCAFENGTVFDETYRETPYEFQLNTGRAVDGLELGVGCMRVGEQATLTCEPEWAFGSAGAGDTVPADSIIIYEAELLGWEEGPPIENDEFDLRAYRADMEGKPISEGETEHFRWRESASELAISFALGEDQGARDVRCDFRPRLLSVQVGGGAAVEGELRGKVSPEDCYWVIDDESGDRELKVVLAKAKMYDRWDGVFRRASAAPHSV
jgi:hypothetical protein